jgi:major type 1 subunit fimbrin (pilin)
MVMIFRMARLLVLAWTLLVSGGAWAANGCTGGPGTVQVVMPATVSVARDAPIGSLLTNWVSAINTNMFTCTVPAYGTTGGVRDHIGSFTSSSGITSTYTVWNTNVPGVGIAIGMAYYSSAMMGNCTGSFIGWSGWGSPPNGWSGYTCAGSSWGYTTTIGSQVVVALVKTGAVSEGGTISGVVAQTAPVYGTLTGTLTAQAYNYELTPINIVPMTCTTPPVNVPMGDFTVDQFPTVGSLSPQPAPVVVQLLNCPAGTVVPPTQAGIIHSVTYRIDPSNGTLATNVASLSGSSPAGGVGIQLFSESGSVFPLSSPQALTSFNGTTGGNYQIPLTARYIRTGTVTPGPANAIMTLTVSYQ